MFYLFFMLSCFFFFSGLFISSHLFYISYLFVFPHFLCLLFSPNFVQYFSYFSPQLTLLCLPPDCFQPLFHYFSNISSFSPFCLCHQPASLPSFIRFSFLWLFLFPLNFDFRFGSQLFFESFPFSCSLFLSPHSVHVRLCLFFISPRSLFSTLACFPSAFSFYSFIIFLWLSSLPVNSPGCCFFQAS